MRLRQRHRCRLQHFDKVPQGPLRKVRLGTCEAVSRLQALVVGGPMQLSGRPLVEPTRSIRRLGETVRSRSFVDVGFLLPDGATGAAISARTAASYQSV